MRYSVAMLEARGARRKSRVALAALLVCGGITLAEAVSQGTIKVIANPNVPGKSIQKQTLGHIFLRRVDKWGNGAPIKPVDQLSSSPIRTAFNRSVLGFSPLEVQQYWVAQMSKGKIPPPVVKSDDDVIAFVASNPGAIGYVSETATTPDAVKVLEIE